MNAVIIATLNRPRLLLNLLNHISQQKIKPDIIYISDASDPEFRIDLVKLKKLGLKVEYEFSAIKSAAIQRNNLLRKISKQVNYVSVLDDDLGLANDYFEKVYSFFRTHDCIGCSGITNDSQRINFVKKLRILRILKRLFLLDSSKQGSVTAAGVNVPYSKAPDSAMQVQWLIGCSNWDMNKVRELEYPNTFKGQSLFEDVIFSLKAGKKGKLFVAPDIRFDHFLSPIERPNNIIFYKMWIQNRFFVLNEIPNRLKYLAFHWANLGKLIQIILTIIFNPKLNSEKLFGIIQGYYSLSIYLLKKYAKKN